jgi:hypothetical protein
VVYILFFFFLVYRGCLGQFARTSTNPTGLEVNDHVSLQWPSYEQPQGSNLRPQREQTSWSQALTTGPPPRWLRDLHPWCATLWLEPRGQHPNTVNYLQNQAGVLVEIFQPLRSGPVLYQTHLFFLFTRVCLATKDLSWPKSFISYTLLCHEISRIHK